MLPPSLVRAYQNDNGLKVIEIREIDRSINDASRGEDARDRDVGESLLKQAFTCDEAAPCGDDIVNQDDLLRNRLAEMSL